MLRGSIPCILDPSPSFSRLDAGTVRCVSPKPIPFPALAVNPPRPVPSRTHALGRPFFQRKAARDPRGVRVPYTEHQQNSRRARLNAGEQTHQLIMETFHLLLLDVSI